VNIKNIGGNDIIFFHRPGAGAGIRTDTATC